MQDRGLLFQVCLVCTHPGQQPTAERGNGGYLFKVGDNRGTMASEGSKELMRGAVVVVGVKTQHNRGPKSGRRGWRRTEGEVLLSAESNGTQRAGEDTIKVWSQDRL